MDWNNSSWKILGVGLALALYFFAVFIVSDRKTVHVSLKDLKTQSDSDKSDVSGISGILNLNNTLAQIKSQFINSTGYPNFDFASLTIYPETDPICLQGKNEATTNPNSTNGAIAAACFCSNTAGQAFDDRTKKMLKGFVQSVNEFYMHIDKVILVPPECCSGANNTLKELFDSQENVFVHCISKWATLKESFSPAVQHFAEKNKNCCGLREFFKLDAFSLVQYNWVLMLDWDIRMKQPIDELFYCIGSGRYNFLGATGTGSPLNGGMWMFKPDLNVMNEMKYLLKNGIYDNEHFWFHSNIKQFYGGETNQGFGFWYFFFYKRIVDFRGFRARYVLPTVYDCGGYFLPNRTKMNHKCHKTWTKKNESLPMSGPPLNNYIL